MAGGALAGALICIALAVAGLLSLNRQIKDFQRVPVPGQANVTFTQPGSYVIFLEGEGRCCSLSAGGGDSAPFPAWSMNVALEPVHGGPPVSIRLWRGVTESYGVTGHEGQAAMYFKIGRPGRYLLAATNVVPARSPTLPSGAALDTACSRSCSSWPRCLSSSRLAW